MSTPTSKRRIARRTSIRARASLPFEKTREVRDRCLCLSVHRAARALARRFDEALRPLRLTHGQFSLMTSLNRPHPPVLGEVAALLSMDRTTLTAALKSLQHRGLVEVRADEKDKRSRRLILTPAGRALLTAAYPIWKATHGMIEAAPGAPDSARLRADLAHLACDDEPILHRSSPRPAKSR
jgi:DNA-binding MarR family transcriptional regulator